MASTPLSLELELVVGTFVSTHNPSNFPLLPADLSVLPAFAEAFATKPSPPQEDFANLGNSLAIFPVLTVALVRLAEAQTALGSLLGCGELALAVPFAELLEEASNCALQETRSTLVFLVAAEQLALVLQDPHLKLLKVAAVPFLLAPQTTREPRPDFESENAAAVTATFVHLADAPFACSPAAAAFSGSSSPRAPGSSATANLEVRT